MRPFFRPHQDVNCRVAHRQSDKEFLQGTMNYPTSAIIAGFQRLNCVREV